jgi:transposase-like protein
MENCKEGLILVGCPYCQAPGYECHKNGRNPGGSQRYHCRLCHRHFTPEARAAKRLKQEQACKLLASPGTSARAVAAHLGIHHQTVLRWLSAQQPLS